MESNPKLPLIKPQIRNQFSQKQHKFNIVFPVFFSKDIHNQLYSNKENYSDINYLETAKKNTQPIFLPQMAYCPFATKIPFAPQSSQFYRGASMILDWLYLGSFDNASNKTELKALKIQFILNCAIECKNLYPLEYHYKHLKIKDEERFNIVDYFTIAFDFIEKAKASHSKILIHCQMGISRSVTIVIAYLMKYHHYSLKQAFVYVKARRYMAFPNYGFMEQLIKYETAIKKKSIQKKDK